ncbi:MAG: vWA domain-containing protein [Chloroflexota bacterium]|nr:vWA domain-containing protein [Chloroflexota bacterium]
MKSIHLRREKGQSLIIVAFAVITLIGFIGLAVDLGLAYVERIRTRRAADAAALAAATELPLEQAAAIRALEYLEENDYGCGLTVGAGGTNYYCTITDTVRVEINMGAADQIIMGGAADAVDRIIRINTSDYRDASGLNSADRIRVEVEEKVGIFFMRVMDFTDVAVLGKAIAENINHLDVVLVFDKSGSMEYDTLCYGCWAPVAGKNYPDGALYPLPWDGSDPADGPPDHCEGNAPLDYDDNTYMIIEAEEYSRNEPTYLRDLYTIGDTYWVLGRNGTQAPSYMKNYYDNTNGAFGRDTYGAYIRHQPFGTTGLSCYWSTLNNGNQECTISGTADWGGPRPAPQADYDFEVPHTGTWYVWIRAQGNYVFWGLDDTPYGECDDYEDGTGYHGVDEEEWVWRRAGSEYLNGGAAHTLNVWAGHTNAAVDRLIITDDSRDPHAFFNYDYYGRENGTRYGYYGVVNTVLSGSYFDNNRTRDACDPCDARFGASRAGAPSPPHEPTRPYCAGAINPQDRYLDDIYDDEQPIRGAVEAAKNFVRRLDPRYDQIGYIYYSSSASIRSELQCVRRTDISLNQCVQGYNAAAGVSSDVIENTVIAALDATRAGGNTNIADGIKDGIDVLSNKSGHYGRPGAAPIMILMTDGVANISPNSTCYAQDYWPHNEGDSSSEQRGKDCVVYYASKSANSARNNGIVIYTITLGAGADIELMEYVAEETGGLHRHAPRPEQLDAIFDELYERIFLRLVE